MVQTAHQRQFDDLAALPWLRRTRLRCVIWFAGHTAEELLVTLMLRIRRPSWASTTNTNNTRLDPMMAVVGCDHHHAI